MTKTYQARARREGRWWIISVPELDAVTQARTVREIDRMARGLIEALLDLDEAEVRVDVTIELPVSVADAWREAAELQARAERDSRRAAELRRDVVETLLGAEQLTQSEAGTLLGISYQRVQQLAGPRVRRDAAPRELIG
ncbi:antitoxin HicB [Agromyces aerolatus]|uniref:antitoxin HicB n=1 Tax=Agromyces sp. LY-1074 TaxID=3074080 RepID=UPI002856B54A|nr:MULTISPECIES: antitoxin HicB [unclassified Agromyces]MDR5700638.1 antitoxin HicB [Agromyces sp. LY-1074]MDR5707159.1 antitoxin HicB [Agromyces sp. LY-1358]